MTAKRIVENCNAWVAEEGKLFDKTSRLSAESIVSHVSQANSLDISLCRKNLNIAKRVEFEIEILSITLIHENDYALDSAEN